MSEQRFAVRRLVQFEGTAGGQNGGSHVARRHIGFGEFLVGACQIRFKRQRALDMGNGRVRLTLRRQRRAQAGMGFGVVRLERQNLAIICRRRVPAPLLRQHIGEIEPRRGGVRCQCQRTLVAGDGFGQSALLTAYIAEIEMGERVIAANLDRALEMRCHAIEPVLRAPCQRDVVVIFRLAAVGGDGLLDQFHGRCRVAGVKRDQPEIVQAVRVRRNLGQDLPIVAFGFSERAAPMMCHRRAELIGNRGRRVRHGR